MDFVVEMKEIYVDNRQFAKTDSNGEYFRRRNKGSKAYLSCRPVQYTSKSLDTGFKSVWSNRLMGERT